MMEYSSSPKHVGMSIDSGRELKDHASISSFSQNSKRGVKKNKDYISKSLSRQHKHNNNILILDQVLLENDHAPTPDRREDSNGNSVSEGYQFLNEIKMSQSQSKSLPSSQYVSQHIQAQDEDINNRSSNLSKDNIPQRDSFGVESSGQKAQELLNRQHQSLIKANELEQHYMNL